jgi:hypothetical protein
MSIVSYTGIRFPDGFRLHNTRKGSIMIKIKVYMILLKKFNTSGTPGIGGTPGMGGILGIPGTGIRRIKEIICRSINSITENGNARI